MTLELSKSCIEEVLLSVKKPGRYIGREFNMPSYEDKTACYKFAFCFPDVYEVGMSYLGLKIIYETINNDKDFSCERIFAPWPDMELKLKENKIPLFGLETYTPLDKFDIIGFTLPYQLNYTNILTMLELGRVEIQQDKRLKPLVIAGGSGCFNPEPLADFFDAFLIGDGEELITEVLAVYKNNSPINSFDDKTKLLTELAKIQGVYVPSFYRPLYDANNNFAKLSALNKTAESIIKKRIFKKIANSSSSGKFPVPYIETIHERICIEVMRGCVNGCRFCEAGFTQRPRREKNVEEIINEARLGYKNTGFDEVSLLSLSASDYSGLLNAIMQLNACFKDEKVSIALPSLKIEDIISQIPEHLAAVKKTGFTFAPEAATERLRRIINKNIDLKKLEQGVLAAYRSGWKRIKLYFMIGLPHETDEDLAGIIDLCVWVSKIRKQVDGKSGTVVASISNFIPKPHTPFQWVMMQPAEQLLIKQKFIKQRLTAKNIILKFHDPRRSILEAIISRGDRRLSLAIEAAYRLGAKFDAWDEYFNFDLWLEAFSRNNIDIYKYLNKKELSDALPWQHISTCVEEEFLQDEYKRAQNQEITPSCQYERCSQCGVCKN